MFLKLLSQSNKDSELIFLGSPEAEAEALPNAKLPLAAVYKDHNNLMPALADVKFIIVGRKGSGKSAFAEHMCSVAESKANMFTRFIRQGESNLEHIVQIGIDNGHEIERENLYKWLILTNILKMFSDNIAISDNKDYELLKQFLSRNSGYIDIRESEVKELIRKQGFEVNIEYLKRFFRSKMNKNLEIKQSKAAFYKLIPHLEDVVTKVLTSPEERTNENSYVIFFDDLDINFSTSNDNSVNSLISLLRVSKEINNNLFAKNKLDSKVVILIRDDIKKDLSARTSDTAKIFSSYAVNINWYQDEYNAQEESETNLHIREFLNSRIEQAFQYSQINYNQNDPWKSLVEEPFKNTDENTKTSFKYILDHTLFRPRDLLLFFKPLSTHEYNFPLSKQDVNHLIGRYCEELITELKNELSSFYTSTQIATIFNAFGEISSRCQNRLKQGVPYVDAVKIIENNCTGVVAADLLDDMYSRSLLGNMATNGFVYFKHREPSTDTYDFNRKLDVIVHSALRVYCLNKGYAQ